MNLHLGLQQKLAAKLALTPQLKQSLEILKLSMQELEVHIREQANSNPLIELTEPRHELLDMARIRNSGTSSTTGSADGESFDPLLFAASEEESMEDFLIEQLIMQKNLSKLDKDVLVYMIGNLSESGYLECDLEEIGEKFNLAMETCEKLLGVLQSFEPAGVGARRLAECLYLQLVRNSSVPKFAAKLVLHHLEELVEGSFELLAAHYEVEREDVEQVVPLIQQLSPYPFREGRSTKMEYIIPDLAIEEFNGELIIQINEQHLPQISINSFYEEMLCTTEDESAKDYLKTKLSDAVLLVRGIQQRHETLYKVTEAILQKQAAFMQKGQHALIPMTLKDIAQTVELHESTISRSVRHKYIQTPHGTFAMKRFFVRGVKMDNGDIESIISIKEKIKDLIHNENSRKPLSDQKIANRLLEDGIGVARRTVAKYREELGILPSAKRVVKR